MPRLAALEQLAHGCPPRDVVAMLAALLSDQRAVLREHLVGVYLRGSLAVGDFDPGTSDLDFFAVIEQPISHDVFAALAALHAHLDALPNRYAGALEGSYIDRAGVRRFVPGQRHPTIGRGEALRWSEHDYNWVLERWIVREHGVILLGPDPKELIAPISSEALQDAVRRRLPAWDAWAHQPDEPEWQLGRSHRAYVVETMCRALHTLATGELASKPQAVAWAVATLPEPWRSTVERSRAWRADATVDHSIWAEVARFVGWAARQAEGS